MRLRTKLIISFALVVLIAVVASGAFALPLLQDYQERRYEAEVQRNLREKAETLNQALFDKILNTNPNSALIKEALPVSNSKTTPTWPTETPPIERIREVFKEQAQARGLRLLVIRPRDRLVLIDTEPEATRSFQGIRVPARRPGTVPPPTSSGSGLTPSKGTAELLGDKIQIGTRDFYSFDQVFLNEDKTSKGVKQPYYLVFRAIANSGPNLFGLNALGRPSDVIYATIFPAPPQPDVWGDMLPNLALAGLAALLLSLIPGWWIARTISRPLVKLTQASEALAKGDYSYTVPVEGGYELSRLAKSYNYMSQEVEAYQRMQRDLIGNVSHELKTPLTAILGFSQAMVDGALKRSEDFAGAAEIIHGETERMIRLVNSLLDLSKLESGQVTMAKVKLDLTEILDRSVKSFAPRAEAAGIRLVRQFEEIPIFAGDPDRLRQVFNNLIENALKYTPAGGQLTVSCFYKEGYIKVSVADTGAGISAEDLGHIFERFYQANKSRSREVEGVGLGLAITREIVNAHGGKIEAQSKVGAGTRFIVSLPANLDGPISRPPLIQTGEPEKTLLIHR